MSGGTVPGEVEAIVPVRGLPAGKTRLAAVLSVNQRNRLVRAMLHDVVTALQQATLVSTVTIFSRDAAAAREAERLGTTFLQQPANLHGLNAAIAYAQQQRRGSPTVLIIPADLPLITPSEIDELVAAAADAPRAVVIAPAADGGTNGLLLRPPAIIEPAYGPDSAKRHEDAARRTDASVSVLRSPHWLLDLDTPEQMGRLLALATARSGSESLHTLQCLRDADFPTITVGQAPSSSDL